MQTKKKKALNNPTILRKLLDCEVAFRDLRLTKKEKYIDDILMAVHELREVLKQIGEEHG